MRHKLLQQLNKIEQDHSIKILYACEIKKNTRNLTSKEDRFDLRFIYMNEKERYLSLEKNSDSMQVPIEQQNLSIKGWELTEALKLIRDSNPVLLECLQSKKIVMQKGKLIHKLKEIQSSVFNPRACYHYYFIRARNKKNILFHSEQSNLNNYLIALEPLLACKWIEKYNTMPSIEFPVLVDKLLLNEQIKKQIVSIRNKKIEEVDNISFLINSLNRFMQGEIMHIASNLHSISQTLLSEREITIVLDELFREVLNE